jgi:glycosyltransferase involved in cell wall biosynthesis
LVSILVVVFQSNMELCHLLDNLTHADLSDAEVIVVDGASTDGTLQLLGSSDVVTRWISEPDRGIYDAMNKAIRLARGSFLLHLNAGDTLVKLPTDILRQCLADAVDVATFPVLVDGEHLFHPRRNPLRTRIENTWHHQGTFYRRQAHLLYDPAFRVYGDFDHNRRLQRGRATIRLFHEPTVATHSTGGISTLTSSSSALREVWTIVRRHAGILFVPIAFAKFHLYLLRERFRSSRKPSST